ncbi:MAG: hypothetical protein ABJA80_08295 [bacterium]
MNDAAPRDDDELTRNAALIAARLAALGIALDGRESPDDLATLEEAVERFETAVQSRGGDLMMDEAPPGKSPQPDDPHFALPMRHPHETIVAYGERLAAATDGVRHHRPLS